jgi:hypothetical protein
MQTQKNNVVYMVIWIVLLILVAWPLAWFIAPIWVFLLAFEALIPQGTLIAGVWHDEGFRCIERSPHAFSSLARFCNFLTSSRSLSRIAPSVKDVNSFLEKYVCQVAPTARLPNTLQYAVNSQALESAWGALAKICTSSVLTLRFICSQTGFSLGLGWLGRQSTRARRASPVLSRKRL